MRFKSGNVLTGDVRVAEFLAGAGVGATLSEHDGVASLLLGTTGVAASATLTAPSAVGDASITIDSGQVPSTIGTSPLWVVIDENTTSAETRKVSSIVGGTLNLTTQKTNAALNHLEWAPGGRNSVRASRDISSIVGNGVTTTVTTSTAHQLASSDSVVIYGTTHWNDPTLYSASLLTVTITVTGATTFTFASTVNNTDNLGYVVKTSLNRGLIAFFPDFKVTVTGSTSNNGVFTVARIWRGEWDSPNDWNEIFLTETVAAENTNAATTFTTRLNYTHAAGATVRFFQGDTGGALIPAVWYGVKASGSSADAATNRQQLQHAINDSFYQAATGVRLPHGTVVVNNTVFPEVDQFLVGAGPNHSIISCSTTGSGFATIANDVAVLVARQFGMPAVFAQSDIIRTYWRDFRVSANSVAGLNGILGSGQQPAAWVDIRVDGTTATALYDLCCSGYQQMEIVRPELVGHAINGLYLKNGTIMSVDALDCEQHTTNEATIDNCVAVTFAGRTHFESQASVNGFNVINQSSNIDFGDGWHSSPGGGTTFKINSTPGDGSNACSYRIGNWHWTADSGGTSLAVVDTQRGWTFKAKATDGSDNAESNGPIVMATPQVPTTGTTTTVGDYALIVPGLAARDVRIGTPNSFAAFPAANIRSRVAAATAGEWHIDCQNTAATNLFQVLSDSSLKVGTAAHDLAPVKGILSKTATWDPASVADGAMTSTTIAVTGAAIGDLVTCGFSLAVPAGAILAGSVTASGTVTVTLFNKTGGALDLASGTLRVGVHKF